MSAQPNDNTTLGDVLSAGGDAAANQTPAVPIPAAPNGYVQMVKQLFHFKTEKLRDTNGKEIGTGKKHPSVEMFLPTLKPSRISEFFADTAKYAKELELLNGAILDVIYKAARQQINEAREKTPDLVVTQAVLNYDKLDWTAIANMPKSERGSYVPSDEEMTAFCESYSTIMPALLNKSKEKIDNHVAIFKTTFKKQRSNKDMLEYFQTALSVYTLQGPPAEVEDNLEVVEYLDGRLSRMLKSEEKVTMDDI